MLHILLPTDFSEASLHAIEYALLLFGNESPEFHLLNVYDIPPTNGGSLISMHEVIKQSREEDMKELIDNLTTKYRILHPQFRFFIEPGNISSNIQALNKEYQYDFIVMGTTGASGLKEVLLGSTASSVIQNVHLPVFVIPEKAPIIAPTSIALAVNQNQIPEDASKLLAYLVEKFNSKLHLIHIENSKDPLYLDLDDVAGELRKYLPGHIEIYQSSEKNEKTEEAILDYLSEHDIHLLVTLHKKRNFIQKLFSTSFTKQLAMHVNTAMLSIPLK